MEAEATLTTAAAIAANAAAGPRFSPAQLRVWRCVGLFATHDMRDHPYIIIVSVQPRDTTTLKRGIVATRVSALDPLAPWIFCPLFEHQLVLTAEPDARGIYGIQEILGAPDYTDEVWHGTDVVRHRNEPKAVAAKALTAGLVSSVTIVHLARAYSRSCVLKETGGTYGWQWSPQSAAIRCQLVRSLTEDPMHIWSKRPALRESVSTGLGAADTRLLVVAPGVHLFPVTVAAFWNEHAVVFGISERRTREAIAALTFRTTSGTVLVESSAEAARLREVLPTISLVDAIVAWEQESDRSILGAYASLCIVNPLRPMKSNARFTRNSLPLAAPIVETPEQAKVLRDLAQAREQSELPPARDISLLLSRGAVRCPSTHGVLSVFTRLPMALVDRMAVEQAANVVLAQAAQGFRTYGSTARAFDLGVLINDASNSAIEKILGAGCSIVSWLHGDDVLFGIKPDALVTCLLDRATAIANSDTTPYFVRPHAAEGAPAPLRLICISSPAQYLRERECISMARAFHAQERLVLYALLPAEMGGTGAVAAAVGLLRDTASLRTTAIVTPYSTARRARHFAAVLGIVGDVRDSEAWTVLRAAVTTAASITSRDNRRFESDCSTLLIESAHLFDARVLGDLLAAVDARGNVRVLIMGSLSLVPTEASVAGAAFRDIVRDVPDAMARDRPTLDPNARVDEAALLTAAMCSWKTYCGEPILSIVMEKPLREPCRLVVAAGKSFLPRTARGDLIRRSHLVISDYTGSADALETKDLTCAYTMPWSELAWLSRGELLNLMANGHPIIVYDDSKAAKGVPFPVELARNAAAATMEQRAHAVSAVYSKTKFGSFRSTSWELYSRHAPPRPANMPPVNLLAD